MSEIPSRRAVAIAGFIGFLGALLGGLGECALHLSIFAVPLYFVGYWHFYERLKPAPQWARRTLLLLGLYAFTPGDAWLGSRVYLAQLAQARAAAEAAGAAGTVTVLSKLMSQASFYDENILIGVRVGEAPGQIEDSTMLRQARTRLAPRRLQGPEGGVNPMKRFGIPEEVARAVLFLAATTRPS